MKLIKSSCCILVILIAIFFQNIQAQNIDSLLNSRNYQFEEYAKFKENIGDRTWIKLVNLSNLSDQVIETDNQLVEYYLTHGIKQ